MRVVRGPEADLVVKSDATCVCDARSFVASNGPLLDRVQFWLFWFALVLSLVLVLERSLLLLLRKKRRKKSE